MMTMITDNAVYCMDALELVAGLGDASVDAIITDMPYGTTACAWDVVIDLPSWWAAVKRVLKPRGVMVTTASQPFTSVLVCSNLAWFRYEWIWIKEQGKQPQMANLRPQKAHESILVFSETAHAYRPQLWRDIPYNKKAATTPQSKTHAPGFFGVDKQNQSLRYPVSYLFFVSQNGQHPTQKPVALYEYLIRTYTQPGDLVVDPFAGSGTTGVAARNLGRRYILGDITPEYVDIARQRLALPFTLPLFD